jgi:hypothetical protein
MTTTDQQSATPAADPGTATARPASPPSGAGRGMRWVIWLPGLAVAVGAAVATAHGLYEVAHAARVPEPIAWLYPLITDGLALVAYTATARLTGSGARYAWAVVVLAAGLSGLAQAVFLASDSTVEASPVVRFGVGAWPAVAAAIVAHLLYLLAVDHPTAPEGWPAAAAPVPARAVQPAARSVAVQPGPGPVQAVAAGAVQPAGPGPVQPAEPGPVHRPAPAVQHEAPGADRPALPAAAEHGGRWSGGAPAGERARAAAARHAHRHGQLPTVTELAQAAQVSRGTAHTVLTALRAQPEPLRLITNPSTETDRDEDDPTIEERARP